MYAAEGGFEDIVEMLLRLEGIDAQAYDEV